VAVRAARNEAHHYAAGMTTDPPPPPPLKSALWRRRGKRVAITLGVALILMALLCCAGVVYLGYDGYRAPREQKTMEAFAKDLCEALVAADPDAVYATLSAGARERHSLEELAQGLAARARLTRCEVVHASYVFILGSYVMIETSTGRHTFDLVEEAGEWKVEGDILDDLDRPPRHGGNGGGFDD
jgi:hypothetical protein